MAGRIQVELPSSKSISNRVLLIAALSQRKQTIHNLSKANDTLLMQKAISAKGKTINVQDAGTAYRFMTAYLAQQQNKTVKLLGTGRMHQRPVADLVEALRQLGAQIQYLNAEGFPPLHIQGCLLTGGTIRVKGNVSSQFISALCMLAPTLTGGLTIKIDGKLNSRTYVDLSLALMSHFGIASVFRGSYIRIAQQVYQSRQIFIESDWSAATFFYAFVMLNELAEVTLNNLNLPSMQGDAKIADVAAKLGVKTTRIKNRSTHQLFLTHQTSTHKIKKIDCSSTPDMAVPLLVACALKWPKLTISGLETLVHKESNRIEALSDMLRQAGIYMHYSNGNASFSGNLLPAETPIFIHTHQDHRIAMCAILFRCFFKKVKVDDKNCVKKSFPDFWKQAKKLECYFL